MRETNPGAGGFALARFSAADQLFLARDALWEELQPLIARLVRRCAEADPEAAARLSAELRERYLEAVAAYDAGSCGPVRPYVLREITRAARAFAHRAARR